MKISKDSSGMALVTVLLLTVLMVLMTVSMVFISTRHLSLIGNIEAKEKALKAAEAGVEYAIYMLDKNPMWGLQGTSLTWDTGKGTAFIIRDDSCEETYPYSDDSSFHISFNPSAKYRSVNNLFYNPDTSTSGYPAMLLDTPPYTAKIISEGRSGNTIRVVEAYLVRSDYYPYCINTQGKMEFGSSLETTIRGAGRESPGYVYSNWDLSEPIYPGGVPSISLGSCSTLHTYGGTLAARGNIETAGDFDGKKLEYLIGEYKLSDLDVASIISDKSSIHHVSPGHLYITEEHIPHTDETILKLEGSPQFASAVVWNDQTGRIKLMKDVYISTGAPVSGDNLDGLLDIINSSQHVNPSYQNRVFHVSVDPSALSLERYTPPQADPLDPLIIHPEVFIGSTSRDEFCLDLNGHSIYSESHLVFSIDVEGAGKIVSNGKIAYSKGVDNNGIVNISGDDLTIEISDRVTKSHAKGLFYAEDDFIIEPMSSTSSVLRMGGVFDPDDPNGQVRVVQTYYTGSALTNPAPPTYIGEYNPPPPKPNPPPYPWPPKNYVPFKGKPMVVKRIELAGGEYKMIADSQGGTLDVCLSLSPLKNINFAGYPIELTPPLIQGDPFEVTLLDSNEEKMTPPEVSAVLASIGITQAQLDIFGQQIANTFENAMPSADIEIEGTMVALNKTRDADPNSFENRSFISGGDPASGLINIGWTVDYLSTIVEIQDTRITVKRISCYEIR